MRKSGILILALALLLCPLVEIGQCAGSAVLSVTATILSKSVCKFNSSAATLDFGNLDPSNPVLVTTTTTLPFVCHGSAPIATFQLTDDDGLYETGANANRMRSGAIYIPYQLSYAPATGTIPKNVAQTLTITGQIQGADYQTATAGVYLDTVVLTIQP